MAKKIIGFIFIVISSFLSIYFLYRISINPNILIIFKTLITGKLGWVWTLGVVLFYSFFLFIIYLLFKLGIKWTKLLQRNNLNEDK